MLPPTVPTDALASLAQWAQQIPGGDFVLTVTLFLLLLGVLIFVHELGHYLAARQVGVKVQVFALGFGRAWLHWHDRHGTRWQIGWLPLGGYVQMLGQEDLRASSQSKDVGHFMNKSVSQRAWVVVAGPLANAVLGVLLLWLAFGWLGEQRLRAEVGTVLPDYPAATLLQPGDTIVGVQGQAVAGWPGLLEVVSANGGQPLALTVQRDAALRTVLVTPRVQQHTDIFGEVHTVGRMGITPSGAVDVLPHGLVQAASRALERSYELTALTVKSVYRLFTGAMSVENLTGPLGIANITGQTAHSGLYALLMLAALISVNLCVVNLLPLPVLDGGHLAFLALERLRGRPLGERAQEWALRGGLACLLAMALLATWNDIKRLGWVPAVPPAMTAAQGGSSATP